MRRNKSLQFICKPVQLKVKDNNTAFTNQLQKNESITVPIAHGEGNYFCDAATLQELKEQKRIVFTYCSPDGNESQDFNPNGSMENIAGIINKEGNVLGMMPHPERCSESILGGADGYKIFASMIASFTEVSSR